MNTKTKSDTPESDGEEFPEAISKDLVVRAHFASKLERERDAAVTFAMARAEFLAAKRAMNTHQCEHEWRDRSGNGESEPPCRFEENLDPEEMCEPCQARAKDEQIVQAKSKIASKAWRRFSAILRQNTPIIGGIPSVASTVLTNKNQ